MGDESKLGGYAAAATLVIFIIFVIVTCATVIPQLYKIEENTASLKGGGTTIFWLEQLHEDLLVIQGQLNLAAGLLVTMNTSIVSMDTNIDTLVNG